MTTRGWSVFFPKSARLNGTRGRTLAGSVLVALGCANIVPVMFSLAGQQKNMPENLAVPAITTMGYAGVLAGPALIGFVAHSAGLTTAFMAVAASMLIVATSMRWLKV